MMHRGLTGACAACRRLPACCSAGCAVGPNFKPPPPPAAARLRAGRAARLDRPVPAAGVEAQDFVDGQDIPGQWWTLFQSKELNALIDQALAHNPTLAAAQAALRQANENVAAQARQLLPKRIGYR